MKRQRLPPLKKLLKTLEKVCHEYARERDKKRYGRCVRCGVNEISSANHILPRGDYPAIRFNAENIFGGCGPCNFRDMYHRAREQNYWRHRLGNKKYDELEKTGREIKKWSRDEAQEKIDKYRKLLEGLKNG